MTALLTISIFYSINLAFSTYYISTHLISLDTEPPTVKVAELSLTTMQYLSPRTCRLPLLLVEHGTTLLSSVASHLSVIRRDG
jgi:hypothetical protein